MKKLWVLLLLIAPFVLQYCSSSRKSVKSQETKITYAANIQPMVVANCTPCHFPPKGNKKAYDTYSSVKGDIDEILNRINKNPDEKGFMPFKHPKLSDSTINVFVKWKSDGLVEN